MSANWIEYKVIKGNVTISTANSNLDGTGTLGSVLTGTTSRQIKNIFIKSGGTTTEGMIRFFIYDGSNTRIFKEVKVPAITPNGSNKSFGRLIVFNKPFILPPNYILKVSTEKAETFYVSAVGVEISYPVSETKIEKTARNSTVVISTANSNLDGSGTLGTLISQSTSSKGTLIKKIIIKATGDTSLGMIRIFINSGTKASWLIHEIKIPETKQSAVQKSFSKVLYLGGEEGFYLPNASSNIKISTQVANEFQISAEGEDWNYV